MVATVAVLADWSFAELAGLSLDEVSLVVSSFAELSFVELLGDFWESLFGSLLGSVAGLGLLSLAKSIVPEAVWFRRINSTSTSWPSFSLA